MVKASLKGILIFVLWYWWHKAFKCASFTIQEHLNGCGLDSEAIFDLIKEWGCEESKSAMIFDKTTANNCSDSRLFFNTDRLERTFFASWDLVCEFIKILVWSALNTEICRINLTAMFLGG